MPLADLRAIYELLFRDGVIVAKKDKLPQSMHPDLQKISNLKVIHAMRSLKSKGCVKETFVWKHAYYYITNEGVVYLRNYLHLPPELLPASLQRVSCPASSGRVRTVKGKSPHVPKPNRGQESQEAVMERCIYHHRRAEAGRQSERPPSTFRAFESVGQPGVQTPTEKVCRGHELLAKQDNWKSSVKDVQLPVSLVPPTSTVDDSSKEMLTVQTALCASVKGIQQKRAKKTAVNLPAALKKSEFGTIQKASITVPKEEFNPGEGSKLALEVASEVEPGGHVLADQHTVPLLAELIEKEEQAVEAEEFVLEDVEVVTEDTPEFCDAEVMKQLNPGDKDTTTTVKAIFKAQTSETPYSGAFETGCGGSVVPQEGPIAVLKTTPLQKDQINPAEDPEQRQGVQRAWHEVLEGLSSS